MSGGPVIKDGTVVGIAFQGIRLSDRINYFIPINLVKSIVPVLDKQEMIPRWRYIIQHMFPRLKDYYGLDPESGGVLVDYIIPDGGPYGFGLRNNDIIVDVDGHEIDNFGDVYFKPLGQKIYFGEILNRKKVGDSLTVKVIRKGKTLELKGKITRGLPRLVPKIFTTGNYFILGGVGLVELTYNCITNLGKSGRMFREKYLREFPKRSHEKIVIISEIFPEYGLVNTRPYLKRVNKIDDVEVLNLKHLYETFQTLIKKGRKKSLLQISKNVQLPVDLEGAEALDQEIKAKYGILYMKTPGLFTE